MLTDFTRKHLLAPFIEKREAAQDRLTTYAEMVYNPHVLISAMEHANCKGDDGYLYRQYIENIEGIINVNFGEGVTLTLETEEQKKDFAFLACTPGGVVQQVKDAAKANDAECVIVVLTADGARNYHVYIDPDYRRKMAGTTDRSGEWRENPFS